MTKFKLLAVALSCAAASLVLSSQTQVLSADDPSIVQTVEDAVEDAVDAVEEAVEDVSGDAAGESDDMPVPVEEETADVSTGSILIEKAALYPEGIEFNPATGTFLVSSVREGTIYEIEADGTYRPFIEDERLVSTTGIHIDPVLNRLLVPNTDHGLSLHSDPDRNKKMATLSIYDLTTGASIAYVDLGALRPDMAHFSNDVATDDVGNAYVTDSVSPILYKVDPEGNASVFLEDERFTGEGFNFNGIVYHPDGYLVVAKKNEGVLFKVPVDDPESFSEIDVDQAFPGADGLVITADGSLLVIANKVSGAETNSVFHLQGEEDWTSASVVGSFATGDVYPTTGVARGDDVYVVYGQLSGLGAALQTPEPVFAESFQIQRVGSVQPVPSFVLESSAVEEDVLEEPAQ
ncbi:MAG: hypothetical protein AAF810_27960 [Cyanobacteria bacterium P01_D01_bin.36]